MDKTPITINGSEKLKEELKLLKSVERPEVITAIAEARAQGDLSENAEYDAAKEKQGFIEGRIADIEAKLSNCIIIDPKELQKDGRCVFGTTVVIQDLDSESEVTGTLTFMIIPSVSGSLKLNPPVLVCTNTSQFSA